MIMHAAVILLQTVLLPYYVANHERICVFMSFWYFDVWTKDFSQRVYVKLKFSITRLGAGYKLFLPYT